MTEGGLTQAHRQEGLGQAARQTAFVGLQQNSISFLSIFPHSATFWASD